MIKTKVVREPEPKVDSFRQTKKGLRAYGTTLHKYRHSRYALIEKLRGFFNNVVDLVVNSSD